ncbi:TolC family protein [bacterium]|nr:TolC family protein [bacterium]MBU1959248.1 TolC family protein [bacterium]
MIFKKSLIFVILSLSSHTLYAECTTDSSFSNLSLEHALKIMKANNLELKISKFNEQMKAHEAKMAQGHNYGKLDLKVQALRSNDAGNVFGFKLKSREATFGDFGFSDFMGAIGQGAQQANGDFGAFSQGLATQGDAILALQPKDLNYPDARNHYQTTLTYMLPLYTGGKLSQYGKITKALQTMSQLDTSKLLNEKIFQTRKTFYDISLVNNYITNLSSIIANIDKLSEIVSSMKNEGFAKNIDELEVQARKAEAESMLNQAKLNKDLAYQYLSFLLNKNVESIQDINDLAPIPEVNKEEVHKSNLDIQKAQLGLKITDMAIDLQKANFLPTLGAFGEYGSADDKAFNEFKDKDFYTVGLQLEWNLFNGAIDKHNLEKAKVDNLKVREQVNLAKTGICLQVRKTLTEIKSKDADIVNLTTQLDFANKVYETYQAQYQEGISSISDVLIKQSKELEVLLKLLTAKNERNSKVFELTSIINKEETL